MSASVGLSSTSRMSTGVAVCGFMSMRSIWEGEEDRGTDARTGLRPNLSLVPLDNFFANGQPNPSARILAPAIEPLEQAEDALAKLRLETDPVIANREQPVV